jgi:hypothetical protein
MERGEDEHNEFIDQDIRILSRKKGDQFKFQFKPDYLYSMYGLLTTVLLKNPEDKTCMGCEKSLLEMKEESEEKWFVTEDGRYYCDLCKIPKIEITRFVDRKMPRFMVDIYTEVKTHPNYRDLTSMTRLQISDYNDPNSKHTNYDNKFLKSVWKFLYWGSTKK